MVSNGADWALFHKSALLESSSSSKAPYIKALREDLQALVCMEGEAAQWKGRWSDQVFQNRRPAPLHLEIGCGIGLEFQQWCANYPKESFIALELRYKRLAQSARRIQKAGLKNARIVRWPAQFVKDIFAPEEIHNIRIHFPDPWPKRKHSSRRLVQESFVQDLFSIQKPGGGLEFKTDAEDYFLASKKLFLKKGWKLVSSHADLYANALRTKAFFKTLSQFEAIFARRRIPVRRLLLKKPSSL